MRCWAKLLGLAVVVTGCNPFRSPNDLNLSSGVTPTGSISGQVLSVQMQPISGATVTLDVPGVGGADAGTLQTTTNDNGQFLFEAIPAVADSLVTIHKDGYSGYASTARIPARAGDYPESNANVVAGPFTLTRLSGTASIRVFTGRGYPAKGAKVQLEVSPTTGYAYPTLLGSFPHGYPVDRMLFETTADDQGLATFTNLPDPEDVREIYDYFTNFIFTVSPYDENGDGTPEWAGAELFLQASQLVRDSSPRLVELPVAHSFAAFDIEQTNVPSLVASTGTDLLPRQNMIPTAGTIFVAFGQPVATATVRLTDETGVAAVTGFDQRLIGNNTVLAISPTAPLANGQEYNLAIHAVSKETGATLDVLGYFFAGDPNAATPVALNKIAVKDAAPTDNMLNAGEQVDITFSEPLGFYSGYALLGPRIAYFQFDIDSSGKIGDAIGEVGYAGPGYEIKPREYVAEPNAVLSPLSPSNYTTRWALNYSGPRAIPPGTVVTLAFDRLTDPTAGVQNIWGQPLIVPFNTALVVSP